MSTIEYKTGDVDDLGAKLEENGTGIDLDGFTVELILKDTNDTRIVVSCTLGGTVSGVDVLSSEGGVTAHFTADSTATAGIYHAEFVATIGDNVIHIPSGNNYITVTIWEAL